MGKCTGNPVGHPSWIQPGGQRLAIINKHKDLWTRSSSAAYNLMVDEFMEKWGTFDLDSDPANADPSLFKLSDVNTIEDMDERNKEIVARSSFKRELRERLGSWTRNQWSTKKKDPSGLSAVLSEVKKLTMSMPRKPSPAQYYQHKYYQTRVRDDFRAMCREKKKTVTESGQGEEKGEKENVAERNRFCAEKWKEEPEEFKQQMMAELEQTYAEAMAEYRQKGVWDGTALSYYEIWKNAKNVLPGITDAIGKIFGGGALLFVFTPDAKTGEVVVKSCSGMIPNTQVSRTDVRDFDVNAHDAALDLCVRYGQAAFSRDFCKSRMISSEELSDLKLLSDGGEDDESEKNTAVPGPEVPSGAQPGTATASASLSSDATSTNPITTASTAEPAQSGPSSPSLPTPSPILTPATSAPSVEPISSTSDEASIVSPALAGPPAKPLADSTTESAVLSATSSLPPSAAVSTSSAPADVAPTSQAAVPLLTEEQLNAWMASADFDTLFGDVGIGSGCDINSSPEDSNRLAQQPYFQYRSAVENAMSYNNPMYPDYGNPGMDWQSASNPFNNQLIKPTSGAESAQQSLNLMSSSWNGWPLSLSSSLSHSDPPPAPQPSPSISAPLLPPAVQPGEFPASSLPFEDPSPEFPPTSVSASSSLPQSPPVPEVPEEPTSQLSSLIEKGTAPGKENYPSEPIIPPPKRTRKHANDPPAEGADSQPKPKRTRQTKQTNTVPLDNQEALATRKAGRAVKAPTRFIEEHSTKAAVEEEAKKARKKPASKKN